MLCWYILLLMIIRIRHQLHHCSSSLCIFPSTHVGDLLITLPLIKLAPQFHVQSVQSTGLENTWTIQPHSTIGYLTSATYSFWWSLSYHLIEHHVLKNAACKEYLLTNIDAEKLQPLVESIDISISQSYTPHPYGCSPNWHRPMVHPWFQV